MKRLRTAASAPLLWSIRGYQRFISPALPRSCKYHPSCSQYAIDAITSFGVSRGLVLAAWRLLRCNPLSMGGYDPVEKQKLFSQRHSGNRDPGRADRSKGQADSLPVGIRPGATRPRSLFLIAALASLLLMLTVFGASCSFLASPNSAAGATTTVAGATNTAGATTTVAGATTTAAAGTSTTVTAGKTAGFLAGPLKPLQALFFWILEFLHNHLAISWSWSIVLLTVIVRVVLVPLTWRQIKSMRAMQALQPQIKAIQEKYKNDRNLLNQKIMEFYQENKVSPFGSCLPLLLQLPVFFGLYYMLRTAGAANLDPTVAGRWAGVFVRGPGTPVHWLWIHDITKFDIILMFLYIASQFVASWQTARNSAGQQKMIAYFMPIIVGIFMFIGKWPAGLFIYWFTSNLWTIAQQYVAEKVMPAHVPVIAAPVKEAPARERTPVKKSGGKTSGQKTGQQRKATSGQGQRPNRGTSRPKGSRRA